MSQQEIIRLHSDVMIPVGLVMGRHGKIIPTENMVVMPHSICSILFFKTRMLMSSLGPHRLRYVCPVWKEDLLRFSFIGIDLFWTTNCIHFNSLLKL